MNREVETIREKVHTTADAALFLCFQEVKGSHSKGVIRLPLLHYDIPFEGYGEMFGSSGNINLEYKKNTFWKAYRLRRSAAVQVEAVVRRKET